MLGVGGVVTLAAWNDSEHSSATFTAGTFNIQASVDGGERYGDHATSGAAATLPFTVAATAMSPGTATYARLQVRTVAGSLAGSAMLTADPGNSAGLGTHLRYGVRQLPAGTACSATTYGASGFVDIVPRGTVLTSNGAAVSRPLAANSDTPINYCFEVTLPQDASNAAQGQSVTARWVVTGTSS